MGVVVRSRESMRVELVERVRARLAQLEEAILVRVRELAGGLVGEGDAGYVAGLRAAVAAVVDHGLLGLERGDDRAAAVPAAAVAQAQRAARAGVSLDTVLRRYVLGSNVLGDFLMQEIDKVELPDRGALLREMLADQAGVLDRLMTAITEEYEHELRRAKRCPDQRRSERVRRLLAGEYVDSGELGYELERWHLGAIGSGPQALGLLRRLAGELGAELLSVAHGEESVWAWLGARRALCPHELERALGRCCEWPEAVVALGEPGHGVEGWRLTHLQAQAALSVALRSRRPLARYADVALLASVLRDEALGRSLVGIYLAPLGERRNGGAVLRDTLRAYFAAERNASSAASALGVARHTVERRLRSIEERLGQNLRTRQAELEVALRLEELEVALRLEELGERADSVPHLA